MSTIITQTRDLIPVTVNYALTKSMVSWFLLRLYSFVLETSSQDIPVPSDYYRSSQGIIQVTENTGVALATDQFLQHHTRKYFRQWKFFFAMLAEYFADVGSKYLL